MRMLLQVKFARRGLAILVFESRPKGIVAYLRVLTGDLLLIFPDVVASIFLLKSRCRWRSRLGLA